MANEYQEKEEGNLRRREGKVGRWEGRHDASAEQGRRGRGTSRERKGMLCSAN